MHHRKANSNGKKQTQDETAAKFEIKRYCLNDLP